MKKKKKIPLRLFEAKALKTRVPNINRYFKHDTDINIQRRIDIQRLPLQDSDVWLYTEIH